MKRKQGFTLIEIMIVVLIIGLLAAIAIPSFVRARDRARTNACINNLRQIEYAKETWAMENNADFGADVDDEAWEAIRGGALPTCPAGGEYTPGAVGTTPTCDVDGHVLDLVDDVE